MSISFTDNFTGTDGSAPNARWTGDFAGWEINSNHLRYTGASYSYLLAACTAGNNTISVDTDFSLAGVTFGGVVISYVDANNQVWVLVNASDELRIGQTVAGVSTDLYVDTGHTRIIAAANLGVAWNDSTGIATVTVTGGTDPGSFSNVTAANVAARGGTKIGCAMNTGKSVDFFDNFILTGPAGGDTLSMQACL